MSLYQLGSFIAIFYAFTLTVLIASRAGGARRRHIYLVILLSLMLLLHSLYHLSAFLGSRTLSLLFETLSALFTLTLVSSYAYLWGRA